MKLSVMIKDQGILFSLVLLAFTSWLLYEAIQGLNGKYDCQMVKLYNYSEDKISIFCKEGRR